MWMRRALLLFFALMILVSAGIAGPWLILQLRIDKCLDSGGRWNYGTGACER